MKLREQVIMLLQQGKTHKEIAKILNITIQGVYNIEIEYNKEESIKKCITALYGY